MFIGEAGLKGDARRSRAASPDRRGVSRRERGGHRMGSLRTVGVDDLIVALTVAGWGWGCRPSSRSRRVDLPARPHTVPASRTSSSKRRAHRRQRASAMASPCSRRSPRGTARGARSAARPAGGVRRCWRSRSRRGSAVSVLPSSRRSSAASSPGTRISIPPTTRADQHPDSAARLYGAAALCIGGSRLRCARRVSAQLPRAKC